MPVTMIEGGRWLTGNPSFAPRFHDRHVPDGTLMSRQSTADSGLISPAAGADAISSRRDARYDNERSQRAAGYRARPWSRRSKLLLVIVVVMTLIDFFTTLLLGTQVYTLNSQNQQLRVSLSLKEDELRQVLPELQKLRADLNELVKGKLPRLRPLEYDQVLPLDEGYLKNVTFNEVVSRNTLGYEYKLVVQNNTRAPLWPEIQIYLFNELGIQIGSAEIGTRNPNALKAGNLGVGEVRSYSALVELADKGEMPAYFLIRTPAEARGEIDPARLGQEEAR